MRQPVQKPAMTIDEITDALRSHIDGWDKTGIVIEEAAYRATKLRMRVGARAIRPVGTVSGPVQFLLADTALYVTIFATVGPKALAVTTNMSINFLRKPPPADLRAECRLLKLGARLAVGEVTMFSDGVDEPVSHATGTYALPAKPADKS
jgi:uncharacterized protein (TIGR00369 family)